MIYSNSFNFIMNFSENDLENLDGFVYKTFNSEDLKFFMQSLRYIYQNHRGLKQVSAKHQLRISNKLFSR